MHCMSALKGSNGVNGSRGHRKIGLKIQEMISFIKFNIRYIGLKMGGFRKENMRGLSRYSFRKIFRVLLVQLVKMLKYNTKW